MRILYLPHFERSDSGDFCSILKALPGTNDVVIGGIFPAYKHRWQLYVNSWLKLIAYGWRSMRSASRGTHVVVAFTHLAVLPFILARLSGFRPKLVLVSFIYTDRTSPIIRSFRWAYFRVVLSSTDLVITHSSVEVERYRRLFSQHEGKFFYVPLSVHFNEAEALHPAPGKAVVSAGRSNRDYDTLLEVASQLDVPFKIICDSFRARRPIPPNVQVLTNCHHHQYREELAKARLVVIPLKDDGASSGQMVLLHSMALGKAVVITSTKEIEDYVEDGKTGLTVQRGSVTSMVLKVKRLLDDQVLASALGEAARARYQERYTLRAGLAATAKAINERFAENVV